MHELEKSSLENIMSELYRVFKLLNKHFYDNELEMPVILIKSKAIQRNAVCWSTTKKKWRYTDDNVKGAHYYEMAISAELFSRPTPEILGELMHEMVHQCNLQRGVIDTTRNYSYHNKYFRNTAIEHGLCVEHNRNYGWANTSLNEKAKNILNSTYIDENVLRLIRPNKEIENNKNDGKKGNYIKYQCTECGVTVRATKVVNINCGDCNVKMISEKDLEQVGQKLSDKLNTRGKIQKNKETFR